MVNERPSTPVEVILLFLTVCAAATFFFLHSRQTYSTPEKTVGQLMKSASAADLPAFKQASAPAYYGEFVRRFGAAKYQRAANIFRLIYRLGEPRWMEYRQRAEAGAEKNYEQLHERVASLGRDAFTRLSVEERMHMMDDEGKHQAFLFDQGLQALPAEERSQIDNPEDFRAGRDRRQFIERQAWKALSPEDQAALGSPAALARTMTPERLAFIDRAGIPQLSPQDKAEIEGIQRSELNDPPAFELKYGEPLAVAYLTNAKIPVLSTILPCTFPKLEMNGSLLKGDVAECEAQFKVGTRTVKTTVVLQKQRFAWLVGSVQPALYEITWQVTHD